MPAGRTDSERDTDLGRGGTSFVITLWLEPSQDPDRPEWRWRVTDERSGEPRYFRWVSDLLGYVSERSRVPPPC